MLLTMHDLEIATSCTRPIIHMRQTSHEAPDSNETTPYIYNHNYAKDYTPLRPIQIVQNVNCPVVTRTEIGLTYTQ